ncbi:MAG: hypothetical protein OHK0022_30180 [Roseiflexaceae bacterium]
MDLTIRDKGLWRGSLPFVAVGFNYHPSPTGCQYWQRWDPARIDADLGSMAQRGFNLVRFFLFWADFEPQPGQYDPAMDQRLRAFVDMARSHGLCCIPALLTIWMNGQLIDLPWRQGRDLWTDPLMLERERAYVAHIAALLSDMDNVLAYDIGDEVIHVNIASAASLSAAQVAAWQSGLAGTIRAAHPGAAVIQGQELSSLLGHHAFRPEHSAALDLIAIHGYPTWTPLAIESISSYKASLLVPFLVQLARADGAVLVDELGSYGADGQVGRAYIEAAAHSALANGACGVAAWCWQDFTTHEPPYTAHPRERLAGFLDAAGRPKSAMEPFQRFARFAVEEWAGLQPAPAPVGIYCSPHQDHTHASYLRDSQPAGPALFSAFLLLKRAHLPCEFTRGPLDRYRVVICPSVEHLSWHEQRLLADYVAQGGTLYYSPGSYLHGIGDEELFGIRLRDFTLDSAGMHGFTWRGQSYPVGWQRPDERTPQIPLIDATTATVLACFPNGTPALTCARHGAGRAYYLNAPLERFLDQPFLIEAHPWHTLYGHLAADSGVAPPIDCDSPAVEVALLHGPERQHSFVINHSPQPVAPQITYHLGGQPQTERLELAGKAVVVRRWNRTGEVYP